MEFNQDPIGVKSDGPTETTERRQEVRENEQAGERQEVTGRETTAPLADAVTQLSALLTRVKISDGAEATIPPFDGTYNATQFFQAFDRKMEDASMGEQEKLLRLPNYLARQPLELFRKLRMADRSYFQVRQILLDLYPESSEASFAKYFAMKLTGQANLETYYREKTAMGLQLGLPQEVILETLTEGLPFNDQRLVRVVPPENLGEWFRLVQRIHGPSVPATRSREDQPPTMSGPYHSTPRRPGAWNAPLPPSNCKFCGARHWHSECRHRPVPTTHEKVRTVQTVPKQPAPIPQQPSASLNIVPYNLYHMLKTHLPNLNLKGHSLNLQTLNGFAKTMGKLSIPLTIGQISRRENFHVVNAPLPFGILSINSLHKFRLTIDFNKCTIFQLGAPLSTPSYHFNKVPNVCTYWQCQAMSQRPHHTTKSSAYDNHCVHSLKNTPLPTCPFFTKANCPFYMPSNNQVTTTSTCKHAQKAPTQRDNSHTKHIGDHTPSHNYHMTNPHNEIDTHTNTQQNPLPHACYNTTSNTHYTPQFTTLLQRYTHIFTQNKFNVPCLRIPPVKIPTNSDKIITIRPYRVPICDQQEIRHQIQQMLENGIIEQSFSPFSSPVTLVTKRDKTKRFCIDYRKVNEPISSDVHPLPRIEDILDRLAQAKYFSTADISSAYWQVPIHPDSRPLLAFATLEGLYQPTRLPFGLKTSPQIYERAISQVLQRHGLDCVAHYFDDFIIYSNTLEEHQNHLRQFFAFCEAEKLQLNFLKCEFFKQSIDFLGYTITAGTITPLTRNTDIIHAIKQPHNRKTLQSFLGAVNVYNKFIPEYARLRAPLNNLLKKDVVWNWNEVCQKAFIDLKGNLTQHPILHLYKEGLPCQVYCDASTLGIAGILKQVHPDGNVYPVQYFSRTLRPHEKNYSISELECLAIVESVEKFRIYLMGRIFTIFSDHHALQWLKTIKNPSGRLFRWSLRLSSYEYEVRYIKGKLQYEADLLSRNPFCGFLDATLIKTHQPPPSKESSLNIDHNGLHTVSRKGVTKIIIPKPLIQQLLQTVHTQYNHPGISQMSRLISTQYYWQGMSKDIKQKVKTCPTCQLTKRPLGPTYGELSQPPEAKEPFDLLSLDTIAGFAKYGNTKIYLHVVVDHFSRYAWTFPSKSTSIITYQQVLKRVLQDGSPKRLLTDRAPAFTSPKFRSFLLNRNIHPLLTTSNNPQANGLCERLNATLTGKLRLLHLENPKIAWTKLVKRVTIIYNKTPHSTTGFPPIYLMFGILPPELSDHSTPYPDIDKARKIAHTRTQNKHLQDKNIYDQRHKQPHFEVGDLVLVKLYHHPNTGKLAPYFTGPHTILEIISPNVVRIDRPNQPLQRDNDTIHVNKLKLYTEKIRYISPPAVSTYHIKHNPNYTFPFKHLTPRIIPNRVIKMVETRSGKMQDTSEERLKTEESAKPQPSATIGRDASADPVVLNPNIDIPKYDGTEDPRPWIESLEEIGFLYHWAEYIISRYAAMNMIGSAKTWLDLHKISFTSWEHFKSRLIQDFGSDANKEELKMRLNRMQQWNEPAIRFAEDILVLCNKVDPQMEEENKINWVIGGLKKEYSFALYLNPPKNTNELLRLCKKMDLFENNYQERIEKSKALYNGPRSPRSQHQEQWKNAPSFKRPDQNTSKPQAPAPRASIEAEDGEYVIEENNRMTQTNGLRLARSLLTVKDKKTHIWITNPYPRPLKIMKDQTLAYGSLPAGVNFIENKEKQNENDEIQFQINKILSFKEQERLKQILAKYTELFSSRLGRTNLAKHQIHTEDAKPIKHKAYRVSAKERTIIKDQIDEMFEEGIIRQSSSPWSFPVILVKKRDGKYRFCVDYRKLNEVTVVILSRMEGIKPPAEFVPYSNEKKWETWRESFEIFAIAVNLESMPLVRQRAILKHIVGEKTVMIYKTFHISENDTYPNVKEMLDMFTNHFKPFKNTIQRRNSFFTCVQKERQGIMKFVTELKHLAQECEFENLTESLIRDRLIIGILDREVKIKLLEDPQLTLPRAISIPMISESTCSQVASLNEQKMIEKIEKRNWVKYTIRMENAEAGPSGINPRRERIIEPCKWCGQRHKYGKCPAYGKKCNACGKTNHFLVVCRTKRIRNLLAESEAEESCDEINLNEVAVKTVRSDKWSAVIIINGKKTTVHLDTGAQINVLPHKVINQWPSRPEIRPTSLKAFAYGNTELPIVGKCNVLCQYGEKKGMFEFIVADVEAQTLITGDTCEKLEILRRINHINTDEMKLCSETQKILEQYHEVFQGVGLINSELVTSYGRCKKKSGQIRICLDPRKLNEALVGRHFQTPAPAELLHEIPKAKYYTVLDVKSAYWHIPVAKECRDLLVMTTPFGKFRYNRLPFGLKISAQIFVEKMTNIFRDSFQNITYVDDLLIYADTSQEHNKKLKGILEKAKEKNIKFDLTKAQICLTKVRFLGHLISQNGIDPEPNKIDKLITFKRPEDKKSLQRIMGLYNYLGKFIPNLAASTSNIRGILRKNVVWHWGPKQDGEFHHIKECVRNAPSLAHFDKSKMLILQCDASKDAMGAALLQEDRPLAFASASFSDSQKQYSQIEELLSVYYGCKKFEYLLSGHTFVVQTNHQPLLPLVKKPLSDISPRLQRLVMKLIAFDFKLQYKPGKYLIVADTLSRDTHPMDELPTPFLEDKRMVKMVRVDISDEKLVAMQKDTREDPALVKVIDYVIEGWPICKKDVDEDAKVFFDFRHRLYLWNDLLCIGSAIVIPKTQRNNMLNLLHQSHQGISVIQGLARESLFWPRMSIDIAEKVKNCEICQKHQKSKIRQPLKPFPVPDYPWQTVSLDIFYIQKKPHLLVVDRYSGYPEVFTSDPPTAINVKNKLRETFARFGIPETMMSDNGPPFRSEIMTDFCIRWGIKQLFSSPHLHRSNGLAERNIQTIKNQLIKCRDEGSDPYLAILAYRNTPKNDLPSPAQLCLSRSLRCQIPRITPLYRPYQTNWRSIENAKRKRQSSMKEQYDRNTKSYPKVNVGEDAWCQIHPRETWTPVKISAQADSPQSFEVVTPSGKRLIRNQQFIRPRDGGNEKSQLSSEPITASPEAQHPHCDSPTMGESSTAPIQRSSEETNIDQREGATTSAGISPEPSGRPRFSRGPLPENEWDEDYERLFLNQIIDEKDDFIENIKENLSGNKRSITQNFKEENGCLYKKNPNPEGREWLLVVPKKRRKEIMSEYHNHMLNGHLDVARTTYRLKNKYYWPSMLKDVSEFVKTCHLCQSRKGSNQLPSGLLQPIPQLTTLLKESELTLLAPCHQRKEEGNGSLHKRRTETVKQEDSVELKEMTVNIEEATQVGNYFVQHLPRNPSMFSGEDGEDPLTWFKGYKRVAKHNHWDETLCLANVYFYLNRTALKWFENNEETIRNWEEFTTQLESVFGKSESLRLLAEKKIKIRAQLKGESTEFYIQDVLRLFQEVDLQMSEGDKISHFMKGIVDELYKALLPRDIKNTDQFVSECRRIEALHRRRVTPAKYERLPNVASLDVCDVNTDLSSMIRQIVREEVQRALAAPREEPRIATIEDMVREEIDKTLAPISNPSRGSPQYQTYTPSPIARRETAAPQTPRPRARYPKQGERLDTNEWRTTEGRPICFHCGRPGHVARYCRDRRRQNDERENGYSQRRQEPMFFYGPRSKFPALNDDEPRDNFRRYRSPSPYPGRNGQHSSPIRGCPVGHLAVPARKTRGCDLFWRKKEASKTDNVMHRISTGDHLPTKQRPYRVAPAERQIIQEEVNKMEEIGIIQPSASPWASPVVLVRKKDGSWRFCVDYRRLNKITKKDVYPLPRIDDTLDCLQRARFYSSMDLQSGYWQIDVEEADREKTAFINPDGLYEFKVMPFGLCNAPATFERMMDGLLKGLKWTICLCYLDDIVVFSDDFEEHLRRLQLVLGCLRKAGLCLNSGKCRFGAKTITVLGHEVSGDGICLDPEKIRAVRDFPRPKSLKEVRSFLGLSSYYRRFIPKYAHIAQPLNALLKKDSVFSWNIEERHAFEALKSALISEPVLGHFDHLSPTEIHTDASNYGIGAVLAQIQKGKERAIAYASRTLNKAERNYSTTERECLAIIWAIGKFQPYVFGRPFTIVTDHHSLCWLTNLKDPCGRLARWALRLQEFDVTVVHKSGRKHQDADCLSRSPLNCSEDIEEDIPCIVALQNFGREQMKDPDLTKIADKIQQETSNKSFIKINDTLHKKITIQWLLVVPRHLRPEILRNLHDSPTSGHLGFTKTYDRIRKKFYWPGMYRNVRKYVAHCQDCQRRKRQPQLPPGLLQPIPVPIAAFEKVGMDLLGRFPTSMCGNRLIIVCTDYLTKFAITKALPTSESVEVAKFFIKDVILKHGAPREVITDRGRNFTSSMIRDLNKHCRITHRTTTAYHPQTNGLTERLNKTIADMLSISREAGGPPGEGMEDDLSSPQKEEVPAEGRQPPLAQEEVPRPGDLDIPGPITRSRARRLEAQ
ncbi:hypothetical protein LAZ67_5002210, partial [Cordylochernes scorpioides]